MTGKIDEIAAFRSPGIQLDNRPAPVPVAGSGSQPAASFADALQQAGESLRFSAHAQQRLRDRQIELSPEDQANLASAVEMAGKKGAQESLILFDDLALIVSVRNKVVITAMERGAQQPNVFTNIDSAVLWNRGRIDTAA